MKISYVNHVRDSQEEESVVPVKQLQYSMLMAIKHQTIDLIEPLLSKGTPLIEPLSNGRSALMNACDVGNELIIEKLLIKSMRSFKLFPSKEVLRTLEWLFEKRLYRIIDLTFFSIKQSQESMQKYGRFIEAVEALEKLGDPDEKDRHEKFLKIYTDVIKTQGFRNDFYYYLYYVWKRIEKKFTDSAALYQLLSEAFEKQQVNERQQLLLHKRARLSWNIGTTMLVALLMIFQLIALVPWAIISLPLSAVIGVASVILSFQLMKEHAAEVKQLQQKQRQEMFLKHAREGKYQQVSEYLESEGYVNVMEGVAESTPLREAERMKHEDVKVILRKFGAFSAEGSETLNFPQ